MTRGTCRTGYEEVIGPHREGERDEEGQELLDLCRRNNLRIGNGWYQKKKSHKITRYNRNLTHGTIIDYFIMSKEIWKDTKAKSREEQIIRIRESKKSSVVKNAISGIERSKSQEQRRTDYQD